MEEIKAEETEMIGMYLDLGSKMVTDAVWDRIDWLTSSQLLKIADHESGMEWLYRDERDGRLWERTDLWQGGQPRLKVISAAEAKQKYGVTGE